MAEQAALLDSPADRKQDRIIRRSERKAKRLERKAERVAAQRAAIQRGKDWFAHLPVIPKVLVAGVIALTFISIAFMVFMAISLTLGMFMMGALYAPVVSTAAMLSIGIALASMLPYPYGQLLLPVVVTGAVLFGLWICQLVSFPILTLPLNAVTFCLGGGPIRKRKE